MICTVVWRPAAEEKLAALWTEADNRQAVSEAANSIDSVLRADPLDSGESRVGNIRILTVPPLSVYYDVHEDDRLVAIWAVWTRSERSATLCVGSLHSPRKLVAHTGPAV